MMFRYEMMRCRQCEGRLNMYSLVEGQRKIQGVERREM